jgi:hypothetical protein
MKDINKETELKYIAGKPTINVTFIIDPEFPEKSTFIVDFDKVLQVEEDEWNELNNKTKLLEKVEHLKQLLPSLMIKRDEDTKTSIEEF